MKKSLNQRLKRLRKMLPVKEAYRPCTLFLVEVEPGQPTGMFDLGPGIGAELHFVTGTKPQLPSYRVKLVLGKAWDV
jgi:hypothetical protein